MFKDTAQHCIKYAIIEEVMSSNDYDLLDLIVKLLIKSSPR